MVALTSRARAAVLSPNAVLERGLELVNAKVTWRASEDWKKEIFEKICGSSPLVLAAQWCDLMTTDIRDAKLDEKDVSMAGFKRFVIAHNFLWEHHKNAQCLATRFNMCERLARGEPVWFWVRKIAALKDKKIVWPAHFSRADGEKLPHTVDGVDFRIKEKSNERLNVDKKHCSIKFNKAGLKCQIVLSIVEPKCVGFTGPRKCSIHDTTVWKQSGVAEKTGPGKFGIADRGCAGQEKLSAKNLRDPKLFRQFKARALARHETFNGRLKMFNALCHVCKHDVDKHKFAFEAICVTIQHQMDNGSPIFDVCQGSCSFVVGCRDIVKQVDATKIRTERQHLQDLFC